MTNSSVYASIIQKHNHLGKEKIRCHIVLRALSWLKINNSEYADVVTEKTNLDWMKGQQECSIDTVKYEIKRSQTTLSN